MLENELTRLLQTIGIGESEVSRLLDSKLDYCNFILPHYSPALKKNEINVPKLPFITALFK